MSGLQILFHGEVQLADWSDTRASGPCIKLRFADPSALDAFRGLDTAGRNKTGHILNVTISQGDILEAVAVAEDVCEQQKPYAEQAQALWRSAFCRTPDVWRALGTDTEFLSWARSQKCSARHLGGCVGRVVAAHVRRVANGAGMGLKPEYSAIPLCGQHHHLQHQHGESAIAPTEWWDRERIKTLQDWAWEALRAVFSADSMTSVAPDDVRAWAAQRGLERYLPAGYK